MMCQCVEGHGVAVIARHMHCGLYLVCIEEAYRK